MSQPSRPPQPNPARELAARVLTRVLGGAFAAPELDKELRRAHLSGHDAGLATHLVYGTLRYFRPLNAALTPLLRGQTRDSARAILLQGNFERAVLGTPAHAVVNEYVDLARKGFGPPALVNAVLRQIEGLPEVSTLPEWLEGELKASYGDLYEEVMESLLQPQPLWLRLTEGGVEALHKEGGEVRQRRGDVYAAQLKRPLSLSAAYKNGWAQPINPASYACVLALDAPERLDGARVLDLAGGAGVKAAMLASHGARVVSVDIAENKVRPARQNLGRLHLKADFLTADLTRTPPLTPAPYVLLDAPCSGSGTLRGHPEIALRLTQASVKELCELQRRMLDATTPLVERGGILVYSVCSVLPAEGEEQVNDFLKRHPDFEEAPMPALPVSTLKRGAGVLTEMLEGVDGFYVARLRKA